MFKCGINNPNYKDGRSTKSNYCKCGNEIDWRAKRCKSCAGKIRQVGKYHSEEVKKKISLNHANFSGNKNPNYGNKLSIKSRKLMSKAKRGKYLGENNPNWRGGLTNNPYSLKFNNKLKEQIRKRDNYQCQNCNMTQEEHLIVYSAVLTVHHIDYNKQNCKENNLITLCFQCNARANFNRYYWENYYKGIIGNVRFKVKNN